ncbi:MAG: hypothetical protein QGG64_14445, partial [Candidatus Latescibacteria bacterium]|nr:hypothetical protein [Candidatus Latescibacterota bacterium]
TKFRLTQLLNVGYEGSKNAKLKMQKRGMVQKRVKKGNNRGGVDRLLPSSERAPIQRLREHSGPFRLLF